MSTDASKSKKVASLKRLLAKKTVQLSKRRVLVSKNTRRMLQYAYRTKMAFNKVERLKQAIEDAEENWDVRQQVRSLRAATRLPCRRIRNKWELDNVINPDLFYTYNGKSYKAAREFTLQGVKSGMSDFKPILSLYPPINVTNAQRLRVYGLRNAFKCTSSSTSFQTPKWYYATKGLKLRTVQDLVSTPLVFSQSHADQALLAAYAKVYTADIQLNEYTFEFRQVIRLLKDPMRTVLRAHKTLERWCRRDEWIYIPGRISRRFGKGVLVSKASTGAVLMSMRTKRSIDPAQVSDKVLGEAANRWLQYRYGIAPLASDIAKATELWNNPERFKAPLLSCSARYWVTRPKKYIAEYPGKQVPMDVTYRLEETTGHFYSAKVWYTLAGEPPSSYRGGMHPSQFVNAIWNALPWSFVADWALNIDRWLTGTMDVSWIKPVANVVTAKDFVRVTSRIIAAKTSLSPYTACEIQYTPYAVKAMERMNRRINMPRPTLPPVSDAWQTVKNAMTGLALIYQPFVRKLKHAN